MLRHRQPRFLVLEGLDGVGTTTQAGLLAEALQRRDLRVHLTAEPSEGPLGRVARDHVKGLVGLAPLAAALTFVADRADHLAREVRPALERGEWVVCDRYVLSTLAYQGAEGIDRRWLLDVSRDADPPDLTIFLDLPDAVRAERMAGRGRLDRYEAPELAASIRASYREAIALLRERGQRVAEVDGSGSLEEVHTRVLGAVDRLDGGA